MKKITLLSVFFCLAILFTSCGNDDGVQSGQVTVTSDLLLGKWYFVDTFVNGTSIPYDDHEDCGKDYVEFKSDGTLWQIDVWGCEEDVEQVGTFTISDGKLYIDEEYLNVTKLNSNEFSFNVNEDYDEDGNLDEMTFNFDR